LEQQFSDSANTDSSDEQSIFRTLRRSSAQGDRLYFVANREEYVAFFGRHRTITTNGDTQLPREYFSCRKLKQRVIYDDDGRFTGSLSLEE